MNPLQIAQIVNLGLSAFASFKSKPRPATKREIKDYILSSTNALQLLGKLKVSDHKKFNELINKQVDVVDGLMKCSEWSD